MTEELYEPEGQFEDAELAKRLHTLYAAFPEVSAEQVARCQELVLNGIKSDSNDRDESGSSRRLTGRTGSTRRWWMGAAAAAALFAVVVLSPARLTDNGQKATDSLANATLTPSGSTTLIDGGTAVQFDIRLPDDAHDVALVGDFNGWDSDATPMVQHAPDGTWTAKVDLVPGVHKYAFIVDGSRWLVNPLAPQLPDAGFGPANAVVVGSL